MRSRRSLPRALRVRREAWGFAVGSAFFFIGAWPGYAGLVGGVVQNSTFVVGSVFFTTAATIQLSLSGKRPPWREGTRADSLDWWSAAVQWVGTLLFNLSTSLALVAALGDSTGDSVGWRPDAAGSIMFLISSGLALGAVARRHELWDVWARSPAASWLNAAGSVAFGVSAVGAYVLPATGSALDHAWDSVGTMGGAVGFFLAAMLTRPAETTPEGVPRSPR